MPIGDNGENPGEDDDATKQSEKNGDAAGKKAGDKSKGGKAGEGSDDDEGDDADEDKGRKYTQAEIDKIVQRRVNRATKDAKDKAELSETELLKKERDDAKAEVRERDLKDEFILKSGIDAVKATRIFRMYRDEIDVDETTGKATNLADVLKTAKADFPESFSKLKGSIDARKNDDEKSVEGDMNSAIRRATGRT